MPERIYQFLFSRQAEKFLANPSNGISKDEVQRILVESVKKITREAISSLDVIRMKGEFKGWYRVRVGRLRVIFLFAEGEIRIVSVDRIDFRGNVYE